MKLTKKLRKLKNQKLFKFQKVFKFKKLLKNRNLSKIKIKKIGPSFLTFNIKITFNYLWLTFNKALIL